MIGPRIYYAMAQDGVLFKSLSRVHPRFGTPTSAIILQATWACLLILTNTWGTLFTYVSVVITLLLGVHRRFCDRASLQKTGAQASLQGLGLPARAASVCPDTSMDRLGIGERETVRVARRGRHRRHRHSDLFRLDRLSVRRKSRVSLQDLKRTLQPLVLQQRELFANGNPYHESLHQDRR